MRRFPERLNMQALLEHYGATYVPGGSTSKGHWRAMRCPFHDDGMASAQTDSIGFRCFTCAVFYASPTHLLMERERLNMQEARERYDSIVGESNTQVHGQLAVGGGLPTGAADRSSRSRRGEPRGGRRTRARTRPDDRQAGDPLPD